MMTPEADKADESRSGPMRRCLVSGACLSKDELLRFVVDPAGKVVFDPAQSLPGRGLWLKAERDMIDTAASKRLFSKAARHTVVVPDGLANMVAAGLKRRCLDRLGLARRAGLVAMGFEQVRAKARAGEIALLLEAKDGSADSRRKVTGIVPDVPVIDAFTGEDLGQALGREHTVHVALSAGKLTSALRTEATRYLGVALPAAQDGNE